MSDQLTKEKNTIQIKQTTILEPKECPRKKDSKNEHLKAKIVDFITVQNLRVQFKELQSENEHLKSKVLTKAHELGKANLKQRDEKISALNDKYCALKEIKSLKVEIKSLQTENQDLQSRESELHNLEKVYETKEYVLLKDIDQMKYQVLELLEKLKSLDQEMKQQIILFEEDKRMFLAKNEFLKKFFKNDNFLEKMIEKIKKEYELNFLKISIKMFETKNLKLVKEMRDKIKCFDEDKKVFENKISKLENALAQRVKDFDDVKTELSKRIDKFETYFANLEKENALLKSQLASQNYTSLQNENNDLTTSYNVLKEKYETDYEKLEKENDALKMHYKILFDLIKQKNVYSQVFTKSIPKVNVLEKIYTGKSSKSILKKVSQFTTYS
ncbi:hypothetical protein Tco_0281981 [Tanacetum coccineum]